MTRHAIRLATRRIIHHADRLATKLVAHHLDWLLHLCWLTAWGIPATTMPAGLEALGLPQRLTLLAYAPSLPLMTLVCLRCMRARNQQHPHWRYPSGVAAMVMLTVINEIVSISLLVS